MNNIVKSVNLADVEKILATFSKSDRTILVVGVTVGGVYFVNKVIDVTERIINKALDSGRDFTIGGEKGLKVTSPETNAA